MYQSRNNQVTGTPGAMQDAPVRGVPAPEEMPPVDGVPPFAENAAPPEMPSPVELLPPTDIQTPLEIPPSAQTAPLAAPPDAEEEGRLKISVTTASDAFPVRGATVEVSSISPQGERGLLYVLVTDESGETALISLKAPPRALSEKPESARGSFALYDVSVNAPGYYPVIAKNVSVFAGSTSLQPFALIPYEAGALYQGTEQVPIVYPEFPPSALTGGEKGEPYAAIR